MASAHIEIPSTPRLAGELRYTIDLTRQVCERIAKAKDVYDQTALGGDYISLGAQLGIDATDAEAVYNLLGSANGELIAATFLNQLIDRLG